MRVALSPVCLLLVNWPQPFHTNNQPTYLPSFSLLLRNIKFLFICLHSVLCHHFHFHFPVYFYFLSYLPVSFLFSFPKVCPLSLNRSWLLSLDLVANPVANCPIPHHHLLTSFLPSFSKFPRFLSSLSLSVVCLMLPCQHTCTLRLIPLHLPFKTYSMSSPFLEPLQWHKKWFSMHCEPYSFSNPPY